MSVPNAAHGDETPPLKDQPQVDRSRYIVVRRPILDGHDPSTGSTSIGIVRSVLDDPARFSYAAVGLYMELITYPIGARFTFARISDMSPQDTVEDTAAVLVELVEAGYLEVIT